jgi:hypothetical protein
VLALVTACSVEALSPEGDPGNTPGDVVARAEGALLTGWDPIAPDNAGKIMLTALAGHPLYADVVWVGYSDGSLFRTNDARSTRPTWVRVDEGDYPGYSLPDRAITSILVNEDNATVYVTFKGSNHEHNLWKTRVGTRWFPLAALPQTGTVYNVFQNPDDERHIFVHDESNNVFCSRNGETGFSREGCTWSKLTPADPSAQITTIARDSGRPERVNVGFSNGELYETFDARVATPSWMRKDLAYGRYKQLPAGPITHISAADYEGSRCLLARAYGPSIYCGGGAPNGFFAARQDGLPGFPFVGLVKHPSTFQLFALTRYSGSVATDARGEWTLNDRVLRVEYRDGDHGDSLNNHIKPHLRIVNDGDASVPLAELSVRYWYGIDEPASTQFTRREQLWLDYAAVGQSQVNGALAVTSVGGPAFPADSRDHNITVSFAVTSGSLLPHANGGELQFRFNKETWGNYDETQDYSYDATKTSYAPHLFVALYRNGRLIWGHDPYYSRNE